jgi:uncharacterized membrane protein YgcG
MRKTLLILVLLLLSSLSALAEPVQDGAGLLRPDTVSRVEKIDAELFRDTGTHLLVVTQTNVSVTPREKARDIFRQEQLNGMLILILPDKKQLGIVPGRSTERLFPPERLAEIRESMLGHIRKGNFDSAVLQGSEAVRATLLAADRGPRETGVAPAPRPSSGGGLGLLGWLPLLFFGFLAFLAIRFMTRKKSYYAPGQGRQGYGAYGQPAYGGPMGGPMGGGGWGGGLFGSLAAGLGGALLGNTIYDAVTGRHATPPAAADSPSWTDSDAGGMGGGDFGGWGSDGGDMGGGDFGGGGSDW